MVKLKSNKFINFGIYLYNVIIFFCTLFLINGCNPDKKKLIVENNEIIKTTIKIKLYNLYGIFNFLFCTYRIHI